MDEFTEILNSLEASGAEPPREVILRYDAPGPQPVVERFIQSQPLPGAAKAQPDETAAVSLVPDAQRYVFTPPAEEKKSPASRKGLWIFLITLGVLLIASVVLGILYIDRRIQTRDTEKESTYRYERRDDLNEYTDAETTIPTYPTGEDTKLRFSETHGSELSIQEIYARVNPCTVTVATALPGSGGAIIGTGVIFTDDGYILTNAHVIAGGQQCYVVLNNGESFEARLIGYDTEKDLAVIKIHAYFLPTAEFGDSDALTVGDTVYAIGNPLGVQLRGTLTDGIVSAINRDVNVDGVNMTLIQTNAALNNGNSGGPLINVYGQVVGINTMKMGSSSAVSVEGLGFAIPISSAAWMVNDLIAYGEIRGEPVLGIMVQTMGVMLPSGEPALEIAEITAGGAGEMAGLLAGDRIVRADGEAVESINDLLRIRRRYGVGEAVTLEIDRGGERLTVEVVLQESQD